MSRYQKLLRSPLYLDLNMKQMFIEKQYTYRVETIVSQNDGVTVYNHDSQIGTLVGRARSGQRFRGLGLNPILACHFCYIMFSELLMFIPSI